jgi:DNA repair ATPase RecN
LEEEGVNNLRRFAQVLHRASVSAIAQDSRILALQAELEGLESKLAEYLRRFDEALASTRQATDDLSKHYAEPRLLEATSILTQLLNELSLRARRRQFSLMNLSDLPQIAARVHTHLVLAKQTLGERVKTLETATSESQIWFDESELNELRARKWLKANLDQMLERVRLAGTVAILEKAAKELSITTITTLSKRIAAELVTDRLMNVLREQLHTVGLGYLQAQVVSSGRAGVTTIRLAPPAKSFKKTDMSEVLSEGEQALMGLAAFFAELEVSGHTGPIVLDDPITGLDRENRRVMANRLAEAGIDRQVLVLTHDEEFASMLEQAAERCDVNVIRRTVVRSGSRVGIVN